MSLSARSVSYQTKRLKIPLLGKHGSGKEVAGLKMHDLLVADGIIKGTCRCWMLSNFLYGVAYFVVHLLKSLSVGCVDHVCGGPRGSFGIAS